MAFHTCVFELHCTLPGAPKAYSIKSHENHASGLHRLQMARWSIYHESWLATRGVCRCQDLQDWPFLWFCESFICVLLNRRCKLSSGRKRGPKVESQAWKRKRRQCSTTVANGQVLDKWRKLTAILRILLVPRSPESAFPVPRYRRIQRCCFTLAFWREATKCLFPAFCFFDLWRDKKVR